MVNLLYSQVLITILMTTAECLDLKTALPISCPIGFPHSLEIRETNLQGESTKGSSDANSDSVAMLCATENGTLSEFGTPSLPFKIVDDEMRKPRGSLSVTCPTGTCFQEQIRVEDLLGWWKDEAALCEATETKCIRNHITVDAASMRSAGSADGGMNKDAAITIALVANLVLALVAGSLIYLHIRRPRSRISMTKY